MKDLWFAINCYRESLMLPGCIESIRRYAPGAKIIAVDGAYQSLISEVEKEVAVCITQRHFEVAENLKPFLNPESDDGTLEILNDFKVDKVIRCDQGSGGKPLPWINEYTKRSKYFVGSKGDYYFVIDADERLVGSIEMELVSDAYNVVLKRDDNTPGYKILRIFKHQDGMQYRGAHHALWVGEMLYRKEMCKTIQGCILEHHQTYRVRREPLRNVVKGLYYRALVAREEGAFRAQHGL
jgi:hypothetical protein